MVRQPSSLYDLQDSHKNFHIIPQHCWVNVTQYSIDPIMSSPIKTVQSLYNNRNIYSDKFEDKTGHYSQINNSSERNIIVDIHPHHIYYRPVSIFYSRHSEDRSTETDLVII